MSGPFGRSPCRRRARDAPVVTATATLEGPGTHLPDDLDRAGDVVLDGCTSQLTVPFWLQLRAVRLDADAVLRGFPQQRVVCGRGRDREITVELAPKIAEELSTRMESSMKRMLDILIETSETGQRSGRSR